jgi:hypothetical protein
MAIEMSRTEQVAYETLRRLRNAMLSGPPKAVLEQLGMATVELRIMLAGRNASGVTRAIRRADSALMIWDAWRESAAERAVE